VGISLAYRKRVLPLKEDTRYMPASIITDPWQVTRLCPVMRSDINLDNCPFWVAYLADLRGRGNVDNLKYWDNTITSDQLQPKTLYKVRGPDSSRSFRVWWDPPFEVISQGTGSRPRPFSEWTNALMIQLEVPDMYPELSKWLIDYGHYP